MELTIISLKNTSLLLFLSLSDIFDKENCFILAIARRVKRNMYRMLYQREKVIIVAFL